MLGAPREASAGAIVSGQTDRTPQQQIAFQITTVVLTGIAFAGLRALGLLGSAPLWLILALLVVASIAGQFATVRWGAGCSRLQLHLRVAVHSATTTVIIYAIGWGPTLAVGYLVSITGDLEQSGSSAYGPSLIWPVVGIGVGQLTIATGLVSSQVREPLVHGLGALAALGLAFVVYMLGTKTRQVEHATAGLAASNDAMREFIAIASHELRTPSTVVKGFASTLLTRWDAIADSDRYEYLAAIVRGADELTLLIDDLLTVSKIDAGVVEPHTTTILMADAIAEVTTNTGRSPAFRVTAPRELTVCADPEHVRRILRNYLENAADYGAPPFEVEATLVGRVVEVRVRDRGGGLPDEFVPRAFGKFARAPDPTNMHRGTGLGLSIVRGLARVGGGEAWYEPNQPTGSCFVVTFPHAAVPCDGEATARTQRQSLGRR